MEKDLQEFIAHYPEFENCTIQTFKDGKGDKVIRTFSELNYDRLNTLNSNGEGVFFSVNPMEKGKRDQKSVTKIGSWVCDIDNMSKEEQYMLVEQSPIKPSGIIESKNSLHLYWFASDGTVENFKKIGKGIMQFFKGDPAVCLDYGGLLRLPGFMHMKDLDDPFLVKLISIDANIKYTENEMLDAFTVADAVVEVKQSANKYKPDEHGLLGLLSTWNNEKILNKLSGDPIINNEIIDFASNTDGTKQIVVNGKTIGAWIDKNGYIGSHKKGGPTRIQRIQYYGVPKRKIAKRAIENYYNDIPPEYREDYKIDRYINNNKVVVDSFAVYLTDTQHFSSTEGVIFQYDTNRRIREKINMFRVKQIILEEIKGFLNIIPKPTDADNVYKSIQNNFESSELAKKLIEFNEYELCLNDCIVDIKTGQAREIEKLDYKFFKLPYNYSDFFNYQQHEPVRRFQYLEETFPSFKDKESIKKFIQEMFGYLLISQTRFEKFFAFYGDGRSGKGTMIKVIKNLVGDSNCCPINIDELKPEDMNYMFGKLVAYDSDCSDSLRLDKGILRKLVSGESVKGKKLFKDFFSFDPFVRLVLAFNNLPSLKHRDKTIEGRLVILPFRESFLGREDRVLNETLKAEEIGIFIRAFQGLKRLQARGEFDIPYELKQELDSYLQKNDTVGDFIRHFGIEKGDKVISYQELHRAYSGFVGDQKLRLNQSEFVEGFARQGFEKKRTSAYRGFKVNKNPLRNNALSYDDSG